MTGEHVRVLYVIDSLTSGGAEQSLASLARPLVARGVRIDVAYLRERDGLRAQIESAGATVHSLVGAAGRAGSVVRVRSLARSLRPDVVHTTLFEADIAGRSAARSAAIPVVSSLVNVAYGPEQLADPRLNQFKVRGAQLLDRATGHWVSRFHAVSMTVADAMCPRLGINPSRVEVIPRGRDEVGLGRRERERRERARWELEVGDRPVLLAVARHEHQKGLDVLLDAFALTRERLPHALLMIAGREGNATGALRTRVQELGLDQTVLFLGVRSDVPELLCAADVFVFPSRWEGLPGGVLEAMALEAPIVASDIGPVRETTGGEEAALLVPPEASARLAESILAVLGDPGAAAERAYHARVRFLEHFTIDRIADATVRFYERALGRG